MHGHCLTTSSSHCQTHSEIIVFRHFELGIVSNDHTNEFERALNTQNTTEWALYINLDLLQLSSLYSHYRYTMPIYEK